MPSHIESTAVLGDQMSSSINHIAQVNADLPYPNSAVLTVHFTTKRPAVLYTVLRDGLAKLPLEVTCRSQSRATAGKFRQRLRLVTAIPAIRRIPTHRNNLLADISLESLEQKEQEDHQIVRRCIRREPPQRQVFAAEFFSPRSTTWSRPRW